MEHAAIGIIIISLIALFGIIAFYFDFVHSPREKPVNKHDR